MGIGGSFAHAVTDGPFLLALPVAAAAGLVSFLSPCCLPLMPGYLSFVTGLAGTELAAGGRGADPASGAGPARAADSTRLAGAARAAGPARLGGAAGVGAAAGVGGAAGMGGVAVDARSGGSAPAPRARTRQVRIAAGSALFVAGFSAVFISEGLLFGGLGALLADHRLGLERVLGVITIVMGLAFAGVVPGLERELRVHRLPRTGLMGAPLLGVVFGLGWTPCLGPTLAAVQGLAFTQSSAGRGAALTTAYCLGLGVPFVLTGLAFERALRAFAVVKRHYRVVTSVGGGLLVLVGVLLVTGLWEQLTISLRVLVGGYTAAI